MPTKLKLSVEPDFITSLTKVSGTDALSELIWNALDADADKIKVQVIKDDLGNCTELTVSDNGHGMSLIDAKAAFSALGGSHKRKKRLSPGKRILHGKEGKGRFRAFGLGDLVEFRSVYEDGSKKKGLAITLDRNSLNSALLDEENVTDSEPTGVTVRILNGKTSDIKRALAPAAKQAMRVKFALYHRNYGFRLTIDGEEIDFEGLAGIEVTRTIMVSVDGRLHTFQLKILDWIVPTEKKLHYCSAAGIAFAEEDLVTRTEYYLTGHLSSPYIDSLVKSNSLSVSDFDPVMNEARAEARKLIKQYIRSKKASEAKDFIDSLKRDKIYPYENEPENTVEEAKRQVFDILASQVNEYLPEFNSQERTSKRFTLDLIASALENNPQELNRLLVEVVKLPKEKLQEFNDILEQISLVDIIDVMREVTDRLRILYELRELVYDRKLRKNVLERKHLHKIVVRESWLFGDDYTLGADDANLKNVLKAHLKHLGRADFQEVVAEGDNEALEDDIVDICLFKQYNRGRLGYFENLVIELKRPSKKIGPTEILQIQRYAQEVSRDNRFEKDRVNWTFILLGSEISEDAELQMNPSHREYGHILSSGNVNIHVKSWSSVIAQCETRHQYLKEKLQYSVRPDDEGIVLLRKKYDEFLPPEPKAGEAQA